MLAGLVALGWAVAIEPPDLVPTPAPTTSYRVPRAGRCLWVARQLEQIARAARQANYYCADSDTYSCFPAGHAEVRHVYPPRSRRLGLGGRLRPTPY